MMDSDDAEALTASVIKALANERRLEILNWLKSPTTHFPPQRDGDLVKDGVCGLFIAQKLGVSQPTASEHLRILSHAGLIRGTRIKQWTFYRRDEKRIAKIDGVHSVRNEIGVLPVSQFDDELRYRVSRAIYGNPTFWNYAAMANPPIHIIVEGGHVTLAGVVNSNVERMLARSLATGLGELSVTNALKTDAEIKSE